MLVPLAIAASLLAVIDDQGPDFDELFQRAMLLEKPEILLDALPMEKRQELWAKFTLSWANEVPLGPERKLRVKIITLFTSAWMTARTRAFEEIADAVRAKGIEGSIKQLQHTQIAQEYGYTVDKTGSILHRMTEEFGWFNGNSSAVAEKVRQAIYPMKSIDKFDKEIKRQIASNLEFNRENYPDKPYYDFDVAKATAELERRAKIVADTYREFPVYNRMQWLAREATIDLCEMRFYEAKDKLERISRILADGEDQWEKLSGEWTGFPYIPEKELR